MHFYKEPYIFQTLIRIQIQNEISAYRSYQNVWKKNIFQEY